MPDGDERPAPPEWLDRELVSAALRSALGEQALRVDALDVRHACVRGTGLLSEMYRVSAVVARAGARGPERRSLLVKSLLRGGPLAQAARDADMFRKEALVFAAALPRAHAALRAAGLFRSPLAARCYHSGTQPTDFLVLEDLSELGFQLAAGARLLDREHVALTLQSLASFHATSVRLRDDPAFLADSFNTHPFLIKSARKHFSEMSKVFLAVLADSLETHAGFEKSVRWYRERSADIIDRMESTFSSTRPKLMVLNHGDLWKNNLMFKYEGDVPVDVRLVDFQICFWDSPAMDIQHLLGSSTYADVVLQHKETLLEEYHRALDSSLRALGHHQLADSYPLEQLRREMDHLGGLFLFMASVKAPLLLAPESLGKDAEDAVSNLGNSNTYFRTVCDNPTFLTHIKTLLSDPHIASLLQ